MAAVNRTCRRKALHPAQRSATRQRLRGVDSTEPASPLVMATIENKPGGARHRVQRRTWEVAMRETPVLFMWLSKRLIKTATKNCLEKLSRKTV